MFAKKGSVILTHTARRKLKPSDLLEFCWVSDPQLSPCGRKVAFVSTYIEDNKYRSAIWLVPSKGGIATRLTNGPKQDKSPRWSPDGKKIAFVSDRSGSNQIWVIDVEGGEAQQVTRMKSGVQDISWSPDGTKFAFVYKWSPEDDKEVPQAEKSDVRVIDRIKFKADGKGFWDGKYSHVYIADAVTGESRRITAGEFDHISPAWAACSSRIAVVANRTEEADYTDVTDIWLFDLASSSPTKLTHSVGPCSAPCFSPDGKRIAFFGHDNAFGGATLSSVWVVDVAGGKPQRLTPPLTLGAAAGSDMKYGDNPHRPLFSECGSEIVFIGSERGTSNVFSVSLENGNLKKVTQGEHSVYGLSRARGVLAVARADHLCPGDIYSYDVSTDEWVRLTHANDALLSGVHLSVPEKIIYKGELDWDIEGWLMPPVGKKAGVRYPMVLEIHGGPHSAYGAAFYFEFQLLAAAGYAVLFTNPRGSDSYGQQFVAATRHDWGGADYRDIMAGVDHVLQLDWLDSARLGVTGGSYGGYMTNWIIGQTQRFSAAVSCRSTCNRYSQFGNSDIGYKNGEYEFPGPPWESADFYMKHSPISYVANVTTPLLLVHSENDYRCPVSQAEEFFVALKYLRRCVQLVRFPQEGHELSRSGRPDHRLERLERMLGWFKQYIPTNDQEYEA